MARMVSRGAHFYRASVFGLKDKHKVPPSYSPADECAGSLNGRRDDAVLATFVILSQLCVRFEMRLQ
jgi:hypothetical protein